LKFSLFMVLFDIALLRLRITKGIYRLMFMKKVQIMACLKLFLY
jgi:hypothetical protein